MRPTEHQNSSWTEQYSPILSEEQVEHMIALLRSNRKPALFLAIDLLGINRCERAVPPLFDALMQRSGDTEIEVRITKALERIGAPAVPPLIEALRIGDERVRQKAVRLLGHIGDSRAAEAVAQALLDDSERVQYAAVLAISSFAPEEARLPLLAALRCKPSSVRSAAAAKLSATAFHDARVLTGLMEASADADPTVRRHVIKALGQHGDPCAVPLLLKAILDGTPWVRAEAAEALGLLTEPGAIPLHLHALKDENPFVRDSAAKALTRFGTQQALVMALLGCASLTPAEKLDTLETLGSLHYKSPGFVLDYRFPSVTQYFQTLFATDLAPEVKQGIAVIQREIQIRQDRRQLLRGSRSDPSRTKEELLRAHSGVSSTPPEELLRATGTLQAEEVTTASWLTRLFGRRR
jgi:HEAT repeat protein